MYTVVFYLLLPLIWLRLWLRGIKAPGYRQRWRQRFGLGLPASQQRVIWIHSVSVGETLTAIPLVKALQQRYPEMPILVTTMTPTGSERVTAAFADSVIHCYLPYDIPMAIKRFLNHFKPRILVIMETELWPNLIANCKHHKIPVIVANARLSERSARGYQRFKTLSSEMLKGIDLATQTAKDAERFKNLGAHSNQIEVSGNLKYELVLADGIEQQANSLRQKCFPQQCPVWIAASTHQGEDEIVLAIHKQLLTKHPDLGLIIVPRHPERFDQVAHLCQQQGFKLIRRSQSLVDLSQSDCEIFLGDSMGELLLFYAMADVAFVGGSLVATGGHNLLEPAAFSCPVVVGTHTFNFHQITHEMVAIGAAVQTEQGKMANAISIWLDDQSLRQKAGEAGAALIKNNRGSLNKLVAIIDRKLKKIEQY